MRLTIELTVSDHARLLGVLTDRQTELVNDINLRRHARAEPGLTDYLASVLGTVASVREQLQAGKLA